MKDSKKVNGRNKKDNYTITFKIDADVEDYLKNVIWIKFIENRIETNITEYVNDLIRKDMFKIIGIEKGENEKIIKQKWYEYKRRNNL